MINPVVEIERILKKQIDLYTRLSALEEEKSDAILARDGKKLERLSREQEEILENVSHLETARQTQIENYRVMNRLDDLPREITLKDVVQSMNEDSSQRLLSLGIDLKRILMRLAGLNETNEKLMRDNMECFDMLLSRLRSTVSLRTGYSSRGVEEAKVANPMIFNKMA